MKLVLHGDSPDNVRANAHERTYNASTSPEVATLISSDVEGPTGTRQDVIAPIADGPLSLQTIDVKSSQHMPLAYPLLRPRGQPGWSIALRQTERLSLLEYSRLQLFPRGSTEWKDEDDGAANMGRSTFLLRGRLTLRANLDTYCAVVAERLDSAVRIQDRYSTNRKDNIFLAS